MDTALHLWLNIALLFVVAGAVAFFSCLGSTTWRDK